jgi:hypothetical protein
MTVAALETTGPAVLLRRLGPTTTLVTALMLASCRAPSFARPDSPDQHPGQRPDAMARPAPDSVVSFLLSAAASDFRSHRPHPAQFRDVRVGRLRVTPGQDRYLLCGQFLPADTTGTAVWTPFATIMTSGYEQWLGTQATGYCQAPAVRWDSLADQSSALQRHLDSLP